MLLNGKAVDETTIEVDGVDTRDYPDFCDAYFSAAKFEDGTDLTEEELEMLQAKYYGELNQMAFESLL